jgi:hypothetical protein
MIGVNIVENPKEFLAAFNMGGDIAGKFFDILFIRL